MPDTFTGYYNLTKPEPGGSRDSWGKKLNENTESLDLILHNLEQRLAIAEESSPPGQLAYFAVSEVALANIGTGGTGSAYVATHKVQPGWIACRGQGVGDNDAWREHYPNIKRLVDALKADGSPYGKDSSGDPKLPDPRGYVIRNYDLSAGRDPDGNRALGAVQGDELKSHGHTASTSSAGDHNHSGSTNTTGSHNHSGSTNTTGEHYHSMRWDYSGNEGGRDAVSNSDDPRSSSITRGSMQTAGNHSHSLNINSNGNHSHSFSTNTTGSHTHPVTVNSSGGKETRMKNITFILCIRV